MFDVDSDNSGHVVKLKGFFLIIFKAVILENIWIDIVNDFGSGYKNVNISFHP